MYSSPCGSCGSSQETGLGAYQGFRQRGAALSVGPQIYTLGAAPPPTLVQFPGLVGAAYDNPEVTGVVQLAFGQVRLSAPGANFALTGPPDVLEGLRTAQGYCVKVAGHYGASAYYVDGWTLLSDDSGGCSSILEGSRRAGQVPNTDTPATGGGTQPAPGPGESAGSGSSFGPEAGGVPGLQLNAATVGAVLGVGLLLATLRR